MTKCAATQAENTKHLTASDHALHSFPHSHLVFTYITPLPALTLGVHPYYTPPRTHTQCSPILRPSQHPPSVDPLHPLTPPTPTLTPSADPLHPSPHSHPVFTHITPLPALTLKCSPVTPLPALTLVFTHYTPPRPHTQSVDPLHPSPHSHRVRSACSSVGLRSGAN